MENMQAHAKKMEKKLNHWLAKLDKLVVRTKEKGSEAKTDYHQRVDELKAKLQVAQSKLAELKAAGGENWLAFKTGLESSWSEIAVAFKNLSA